MEPLPREPCGMPSWLATARWFAAKEPEVVAEGRTVFHDAAAIPSVCSAPPAWIGLVDLLRPHVGGRHAAGEPERYLVVLAEADGGLVDASRGEGFVAWLLHAVAAGESLPAGHGGFRGHAVAMFEPPAVGTPLSIAEIGGDASNTSLVVSWAGRAVVVKLLRRCRAGIHPELEVGLFLAGSPLRADVPKLLGWLAYEPGGEPGAGGSITAAIVHERVESRGSAWDVMLPLAATDWPRCIGIAASLGETTARLHAALAGGDLEAAFSPEPWTADAWAAAVGSIASHADRVLDRVERLRKTLPGRIGEDLAGVVVGRKRIERAIAGQRSKTPSSRRIRVHGDYHLGQVLVGRGDDRLTVIDFEGEPGRTLEERRGKTSAAKDVAGMCRSFDYLLRVLAKEGSRPYDARDLASLESRFLASYEASSRVLAAGTPGGGWWPEHRSEADRLLRLYKLDKALYELAYEADHRPDWIDVPLAALAAHEPGGDT